MTVQSDFGLIGLGVMGQNLVLDVEGWSFSVSVFSRTDGVTREFVAAHPGKPRRIRRQPAAVPRGDADGRGWRRGRRGIEQLLPQLEVGDIINDSGNSLYIDTERRDT